MLFGEVSRGKLRCSKRVKIPRRNMFRGDRTGTNFYRSFFEIKHIFSVIIGLYSGISYSCARQFFSGTAVAASRKSAGADGNSG